MSLVAADHVRADKKRLSRRHILSKACRRTFYQFSRSTSIQGVQFVTDPKGTSMTRLVWLLIIIACFLFASVLVGLFWARYKSNPTRVNVATSYAPISELDFPAVTICTVAWVSHERANAMIDTLKLPENVTDEEMLRFLHLTVGFTAPVKIANPDDLDTLQAIMDENRYTPILAMEKLTMPCDQLLVRCRFGGRLRNCSELFRQTRSFKGFCCTFNSVLDQPSATVHKASYPGVNGGISLVLRPLVERHAFGPVFTDGVQVLIHHPDAFPGEGVIRKTLPHRTESYMKVIPERTDCSDQVRTVPRNDRGCTFFDEISLKYFPRYKEPNCEIEERMNLALRYCKCLPFAFPDVKDEPICDFTQIACLVENYEKIALSNRSSNSVDYCPTDCKQLIYKVSSNSIFMHQFKLIHDDFYQGINSSHMVVHIYMGSQVYRKFRMDLLSNIILLIASFGGVYSLCIGMSIISFVEVFYFLTIRFYQNYKSIKRSVHGRPSPPAVVVSYINPAAKGSTPVIPISRM